MNTDFGLIGFPLSQSFSKMIHEKLGYDYSLNPIEDKELAEFLYNKKFKGINITIPYKEKVIDFLDEIDPIAKKIGAVNTIINKNGKLIGYNTDYFGLYSLIEKSNISLKNKKVLILGTGGTSKTALQVSKDLGAENIIRVSRSLDHTSNHTSDRPSQDVLSGFCSYNEVYSFHSDAEIIINTTPCGMFPDLIDEEIINLNSFKKLSGVIDVVYNPLRTRLILSASDLNIPNASGLYMLVMQAIKSSELFTGKSVTFDFAENLYEEILNKKQNIVLTGMPSSGKTTLGRELADKLNLTFFDIDEIIEEKTDKKITDIFKFDGEDTFRKIESDVIKSLRNVTGAVIATGGGSILKKENIFNLKHNGKIFFINVPFEMLVSSENRPLSSNIDALKQLYSERISIYKETADRIIDIKRSEDRNAKYIFKFINS